MSYAIDVRDETVRGVTEEEFPGNLRARLAAGHFVGAGCLRLEVFTQGRAVAIHCADRLGAWVDGIREGQPDPKRDQHYPHGMKNPPGVEACGLQARLDACSSGCIHRH